MYGDSLREAESERRDFSPVMGQKNRHRERVPVPRGERSVPTLGRVGARKISARLRETWQAPCVPLPWWPLRNPRNPYGSAPR